MSSGLEIVDVKTFSAEPAREFIVVVFVVIIITILVAIILDH